VCWVEVRLQEPAGSEAYWQAFRIAGEDLGLDITQGDVEIHIQATAINTYRESVASSHLLQLVGRSVRHGRWGVCPECRQGVERICRAIMKQVQRSDARIEVDVMHTWNECTE
jgi:hypothetical protein